MKIAGKFDTEVYRLTSTTSSSPTNSTDVFYIYLGHMLYYVC